MRRALAYEWVRIRTLRSTWWLTALSLFLGVGISALFAWALHHDFTTPGSHPPDLQGLGAIVVTQLAASGAIPSVICFVLAMLGIFAWGHEYRHGMIRASLTALNSRADLWVAKFVVVAVWVAVTALVTLVLSGVVASVILDGYVQVFSAQTWGIIGRQIGYGVLLTWLAMAFTSITRSQAFALVAIFLWPFLIENLIGVFFHLVPGLRDNLDLLRFRPFYAGARLVDVLSTPTGVFDDPLSPWGGLVIFGGITAVAMAVSFVLFGRRDA